MKLTMPKIWWCLLLIVLVLGSCTAHKKIPYLIDADSITSEEFALSAKNYEAKIMPKDILSITVNTPTNIGTKDFNLPLLPTGSEALAQTQISITTQSTGTLQSYIVDNDGNIVFPVIGVVKIGGLTKAEAQNKLKELIFPQYLKDEPIVNIRFLNYKVTVIGEVAKPGIYSAANEQMTLFDAIAYAGDLTVYGKRDNILLIREGADGERKTYRIDLQSKDILLNNDLYYLQQNDKIYVSPNKAKGNNSQFGTLESLAISGLSLLISIISIITR